MANYENLKGFRKLVARYAWLRLGGPLVAAVLALLPLLSSAEAVISQGYQSDGQLSVGAIVSVDKNSPSMVRAATTDNAQNLFGVVVGSDNALLALTNGQKNQVQVATSGVIPVIVSDLSGDIAVGDEVTASPLPGIGMKATSNVKVVGVAQGDLKDSSGKSTQTVTNKNGQKQQTQLGVIPVLVNVAYYFKEPDKTIIPTVLQNVANTVAGKKVSPLPVIISLVIFIVAMASIMTLVYSAIRSSIISVGRNPLSQAAVYRSLVQVGVLTLTILVGAVAAIYLVLGRLG